MSGIDYSERIPNNVDLASDRRLQRALEKWQPAFLDWWREMGPVDSAAREVYLRAAVSVDREGWANFGYTKMPDYRWGVFLADADPGRTIAFGDHKGEPVWQRVPGDYRAALRRLIVIQGDTEPASVEQQRRLGQTCPSNYDLRNLFQINVEEGRHLWAMVYLLHAHFGRDGREEAEALLERRSGDADRPRILGAFNERTPDWLALFMFTFLTDRDGTFQKYLNFHFSVTLDLFGAEVSTNAAASYTAGLKGRFHEMEIDDDHRLDDAGYPVLRWREGAFRKIEAPALNALNERLRDDFLADVAVGVERLNRVIRSFGVDFRITLPHVAFNRRIGAFAALDVTPQGEVVDADAWRRREGEWLPAESDRAYVRSLMPSAVTEPGRFAHWIAPPSRGIDRQPVDFEYVRLD